MLKKYWQGIGIVHDTLIAFMNIITICVNRYDIDEGLERLHIFNHIFESLIILP